MMVMTLVMFLQGWLRTLCQNRHSSRIWTRYSGRSRFDLRNHRHLLFRENLSRVNLLGCWLLLQLWLWLSNIRQCLLLDLDRLRLLQDGNWLGSLSNSRCCRITNTSLFRVTFKLVDHFLGRRDGWEKRCHLTFYGLNHLCLCCPSRIGLVGSRHDVLSGFNQVLGVADEGSIINDCMMNHVSHFDHAVSRFLNQLFVLFFWKLFEFQFFVC